MVSGEPYDMDRDVMRATLAGGYAVCCGALLRWPTDQRLRVEAIRLGSAELALRHAFGDMVARLDKLCAGPELTRIRQRVTLTGLRGLTWAPLSDRLAELEQLLSRPAGSLAERVRVLEMDPRETCAAVVLAVAEVMRAQWAAQPEPRPEDTPGTPEYRARLRAEIAADIAALDRDLARMDRLIARDRAERGA